MNIEIILTVGLLLLLVILFTLQNREKSLKDGGEVSPSPALPVVSPETACRDIKDIAKQEFLDSELQLVYFDESFPVDEIRKAWSDGIT